MKLRKIIQITSFVLLIFLLFNIASQIDIAPTKNDHLVASKKAEIDKIDHIGNAKVEAKRNLDMIRSINKNHSANSKALVLVIAILVVAHGYLILANKNS